MPYTPSNSYNLKDAKRSPHLFVGLIGESGSGKTHSALTFPNPVVLDLDNGLSAQRGKDVIAIPIHDDTYCKEILKAAFNKNSGVVNKRDAVKVWIRDEAIKLEPEQTLIFDSWTMFQDHFDRQTKLEPSFNDRGKENPFEFWARKIEFSRDIMIMLQGLRCNVVVTFHELKQRDEATGELLDKIAPLMQGKFVARIPSYFDEFYRCLVVPMKDRKGNIISIEGKPMVQSRNFFWQIKQTGEFNAKSRMSRVETLIPAHYNEIQY